MKITSITTEEFKWPRRVPIRNGKHTYTHSGLGIVKIETDENVTGIGLGGTGLIDTLHQADAEYDRARRQELFVNAQKLMYESAWFGYIWFEPGNFLVHNRVKNFPGTWGSLREHEWWIDG